LNEIGFNGGVHGHVTPLNAVQARILALLGVSPGIYQSIYSRFGELAAKMGEP